MTDEREKRLKSVWRKKAVAKQRASYNHRTGLPVYKDPDGWRERQALIPDDTRSFTARFCGDPIPNDPRRGA
jgi:hypothetical protein